MPGGAFSAPAILVRKFSARWATISIVCGVAIALVATEVVLPISLRPAETHFDCLAGAVLGSSGPTPTTLAVSVAPPGGFDNTVLSVNNGSVSNTTTGAGIYGSWNDSRAFFEMFNWTLYSVRPVATAESNAPRSCAPYVLDAGPALGNGTISNVSIAPALSNTTFTYEDLPGNFSSQGLPSVRFDASYPSGPVGAFAWTARGYSEWSFGTPIRQLFPSLYYAQNASYPEGLAITLNVSSSQFGFGVPIHLLTGGTLVVPANDSIALPGSSVSLTITYVFPNVTDQGTWAVFEVGAGSPMSIGGLYFLRTNTTMDLSLDDAL